MILLVDYLKEHLKDLTSDVLGQNKVNLTTSLTNLGTLLLNGEVPSSICPILYGANLCASTVLLSQRGVQQGDPLGPPLFCLGIQSIINSLCSELNI
jgi:hypothetical protein